MADVDEMGDGRGTRVQQRCWFELDLRGRSFAHARLHSPCRTRPTDQAGWRHGAQRDKGPSRHVARGISCVVVTGTLQCTRSSASVGRQWRVQPHDLEAALQPLLNCICY